MKPSLHQRVIEIIKWILGGALALGAAFDSFTNAISLLTPVIAGIGTALIALFWLLTSIFLRRHAITWVEGNQEAPLRKLGIKPTAFMVGMVLLLWLPSLLTPYQNKNVSPLSSQLNITATERSIAAGGDITATAQPGGTAIITTGNVTVDANEIVESLVQAHRQELAGFREREQVSNNQVKALTNAVTALAEQRNQLDAPPGINEALAQLQQGNTTAAETIFETVLARKTAEGQVANQQAAEAARHLGALAFLHDTEKALTAYRRAVALDSANGDAWNFLGGLLYRLGDVDEAANAFNQVRALGTKSGDQTLLAKAYKNLGAIYWGWGDRIQAEAMLRQALQLDEALGNKPGMASTYSNLGIAHMTRRDFVQAEAMYRQALQLDEALGNKLGMANDYIGLGSLYSTWRDFVQAETMYRQALQLYQSLRHKEGIATTYNNLGSLLYKAQGDRTQAEVMYREALEIFEALGTKQGMASSYTNLGILYEGGGDLVQAEALYRQALTLFQEIGATSNIEKVRTLLETLRAQGHP